MDLSKTRFTVVKSGPFKGWLSSPSVRRNSGIIIFTCPICGGSIVGGAPKCQAPWESNTAGLLRRWLLDPTRTRMHEEGSWR
jgi:hypothetical protein